MEFWMKIVVLVMVMALSMTGCVVLERKGGFTREYVEVFG